MRAFFYADISSAPLEKELANPLYLVSYADGPEVFVKNQKMLAHSALRQGVSHIFNYRRYHLDPQFVEKNKNIFAHKVGAGAWLWKPWIILNTLKQTPENSYILYCDSGFLIKKDLSPLLGLLKKNDVVLGAYSYEEGGKFEDIVKKDALIKVGCDTKSCRESRVIWAGFLLVKNTALSRRFIEKWLNLCEDEELLLPYSKFPNQRHLYDQALLNMTYALHPKGVGIIHDVEKLLHNNILRWHHRKVDEGSLFPKMIDKIRGLERKVIDSGFFQNLL